MPYVLIRHKVKEYATWKPVFDEHAGTRKAGGSKGGHVFRRANDSNEVVVLLEWDSLENARKFIQSEDLLTTMKRAGVVDRADVYFLDVDDAPAA